MVPGRIIQVSIRVLSEISLFSVQWETGRKINIPCKRTKVLQSLKSRKNILLFCKTFSACVYSLWISSYVGSFFYRFIQRLTTADNVVLNPRIALISVEIFVYISASQLVNTAVFARNRGFPQTCV